ncbi:C40 family peptidase [Piscibacillus halophilus]|uniref:Cell wall-associated hydrolase, NlpC family n=1 Tax=Piscibacillus halophilus TaxID=571933 RepID=A0A1H9D4Y4_9BACI|nr:C40 family peptidase [Piscibacillus halophilus]SEQ08494.1 Cell wall-associated hydrolase, NlpC family [Piscibacillus halophilus]
MSQQPNTWVCNVAVATIWTNPESPREIDADGLSQPVLLQNWYDTLTSKQRSDLCYENRVQSQLLFGEEVIVDQTDGQWAKIIAIHQPSKKDDRGYPGWVPLKQLKLVNQQEWDKSSIALVTAKQSILYDSSKLPLMELSYATYLPVIEQQDAWMKVQTPEGEGWLKSKDITVYPTMKDVPTGDGKAIVKCAEQFLELPYFWGGMSAFGYDCSGFSYNMHKMNGYQIPRDASDQAVKGTQVPFNQLEIGDLLFFADQDGKGKVNHVGIYYGDGKMIHSSISSPGIEIRTLKGSKYEKTLCEARRYFQGESS